MFSDKVNYKEGDRLSEVLKDKDVVNILLSNVEKRFNHNHYNLLKIRGETIKTGVVVRGYDLSMDQPYKDYLTDIELNEEDQEQINNVTLEYNDRISNEKSSSKIQELKEELKKKLKELSKTDTEYDKRLQDAIKKLDEDRDIYLLYDDGNKNKLTKYSPKYARIMKEVLRDKDEKKKGLKFEETHNRGALKIYLGGSGRVFKEINHHNRV